MYMLQSYTKYNLYQLLFLLILMYVTKLDFEQIHNRKYQVQSLLLQRYKGTDTPICFQETLEIEDRHVLPTLKYSLQFLNFTITIVTLPSISINSFLCNNILKLSQLIISFLPNIFQ